jgi:hypothetical protein
VAALRTLFRCLLVLALWVGVSGAASVPATAAPATATALAGQSDLQARLLDLFGGVGICGDADDDSEDVLCGGDLLAGLVSDPAMLLMSRGQCSRLLEHLYRQQVCDPGTQNCGHMDVGGLPPPPLQLVGPGASGGLLARHNAVLGPLQGQLRVARARDDPDPTSHILRPASPPPRAALA